MSEVVETRFEKIRKLIITILLVIWIMMPVLKEIRLTYTYVNMFEYVYIIILGTIGIFFLILEILKKTTSDKKYSKKILPIIVLTIYMIWTLISAIFAEDTQKSFLGDPYRKEGYFTYLSYAGFFACALLINSKEEKKSIINLFLGSAIINIILVLLRRKGIFTNILVGRNINLTCFLNPNHYGYYLLLATTTANFLFITANKRYKQIIYLLCYVFLMYYLILNNTLGCYLALAVTLVLFTIYCIYHKKKRILSIISIIVFILMSFGTQQTKAITQKNINSLVKDIKNIIAAEQVKNKKVETKQEQVIKDNAIKKAEKAGTNRMRLWKHGINFFLEKPILGYGPENLETKYAEVGIIDRDRPHNLLIQLATTSGIIGLITYITAIGIILIRGLKTMKMENSLHVTVFFVLIAYLISAMFGNSMYYTSPYFFIFLGLLMYENMNEEKNKI